MAESGYVIFVDGDYYIRESRITLASIHFETACRLNRFVRSFQTCSSIKSTVLCILSGEPTNAGCLSASEGLPVSQW
jgi:hypothetical protein